MGSGVEPAKKDAADKQEQIKEVIIKEPRSIFFFNPAIK